MEGRRNPTEAATRLQSLLTGFRRQIRLALPLPAPIGHTTSEL